MLGYGEVISIAYYGMLNGDLMTAPEMKFIIVGGDFYPISYKNDYLFLNISIFDSDHINTVLQADLTTFANQWMYNIANQQGIVSI